MPCTSNCGLTRWPNSLPFPPGGQSALRAHRAAIIVQIPTAMNANPATVFRVVTGTNRVTVSPINTANNVEKTRAADAAANTENADTDLSVAYKSVAS